MRFCGCSRRTAALKDPHEDSIRFRPHSKRHGRHAFSAGAATTGQRRLHLRDFAIDNRELAVLEEQLKDHGAILFRNFLIQQPEDLKISKRAIRSRAHAGGAAPRDKVTAKRVLTSNNRPPANPSPFITRWHKCLTAGFIYCDIPSQQGGEQFYFRRAFTKDFETSTLTLPTTWKPVPLYSDYASKTTYLCHWPVLKSTF